MPRGTWFSNLSNAVSRDNAENTGAGYCEKWGPRLPRCLFVDSCGIFDEYPLWAEHLLYAVGTAVNKASLRGPRVPAVSQPCPSRVPAMSQL